MDLNNFARLIGEIHEAAFDGPSLGKMPARLAAAFGAESCALALWETGSGAVVEGLATENYDARAYSDYMAHFRTRDVWFQSSLLLPRGVPIIGEEVVPDEVLLRSEIYTDYLRRLGIFDTLGGVLRIDGMSEGFLAIHRPFGATRFAEQDKRGLSLVLPHLVQATRLRLRLLEAERLKGVASSALDAIPTGVVVVDAGARLVLANAAAERLLRSGDGLTIRQGRLHATDRDTQAALARTIEGTCRTAAGRPGPAGGVLPGPRQPPARPLSLLVCPLLPGGLPGHATAQPLALIFIGDPDDHRPATVEALTSLYRLTPAEARLAQALLNGDSLQDYADSANLSLHTVKTQLKHVFAKTESSRQSDLIRDLMANPVLGLAGRIGD